MKKSDRVELHPATDDWMRGDRYGTVVGFGRAKKYHDKIAGQEISYKPVKVKLDKSGRVKSFHPANVIDLGEQEKAEARAARSTNPTRKGNPATEVTELVLYAENTGPGSRDPHETMLYNQRVSILANLKRKVKKGVYDSTLAAKLWGYWADSAAKAYNKIHGTGKYALTGSPFSATDRREAAKHFEAHFRDEVHEMSNPRKRQSRRPSAPRFVYKGFIIATRRTSGAIQYYDGAGFGKRSLVASFPTQASAHRIAKSMRQSTVVAPASTPEKVIRDALLGKR
jgi:hypothetical protein